MAVSPVNRMQYWCASVALLAGCVLSLPTRAANAPSSGAGPAVAVDPRLYEAAVERLRARQLQREMAGVVTRAAKFAKAEVDDDASGGGPYAAPSVTARKMELLKRFDGQIASARSALRRGTVTAGDVRALVEERSALCGLPLDKFRDLLVEVDRQNAERLVRYQEAFGDLPTAARTVTVILMKSGQIDFATPLPEDPLTREVEEARGVRRVYYQFYLHPPEGTPRRHNGWVEFVFDPEGGLWVPTWTDFNGVAFPLFDAEAFAPLRPYRLVFDGKRFTVSQGEPIRPPEVFALLTPRWAAGPAIVAPRNRW